MAWRNNTFSNHVHVGVRGADRAVAVCDALRPVLPVLLAASANSPFAEGLLQRTALRAHADLHAHVPALRDPRPLRQLGGLRGLRRLPATGRNSIVEHTQIWWSVRPHLSFGTVELRIMDAQSCADESTALLALATACVAQAALDYDAGRRPRADSAAA